MDVNIKHVEWILVFDGVDQKEERRTVRLDKSDLSPVTAGWNVSGKLRKRFQRSLIASNRWEMRAVSAFLAGWRLAGDRERWPPWQVESLKTGRKLDNCRTASFRLFAGVERSNLTQGILGKNICKPPGGLSFSLELTFSWTFNMFAREKNQDILKAQLQGKSWQWYTSDPCDITKG